MQSPQTSQDTTRATIAAPAASGALQSASQTIHGPQATVVLSEPPPQESPLLALLASSGMPLGQAAAVARKLLEVGITSPDCPEMEPLDEFDLGRIVGTQKGRVIAAFRRAGWLPPKERRQGISAMPPGVVVIDQEGQRLEPRAGPPEKPASKVERQIETLQRLKQGGENGQQNRNY